MFNRSLPSTIKKIALIGSYIPRQCGIATFTSDLRSALVAEFPDVEVIVLAMDDGRETLDYPPEVKLLISQQCPEAYIEASDFLNEEGVDLVCIQHEFGIFGGNAGEYLLTMLRGLQMPVVATLHTILRNPDEHQQRVMAALSDIASRFVVMSEKGSEIVSENHGIDRDRIAHIHHGVPGVPAEEDKIDPAKFGLEGKNVLLTFGLLSPDKGLENVILAMPKILESCPDTVYVIVGATHPHIKASQGERYREHLQELTEDLGVADRVKFINRFVPLSELTGFLDLADIYITPYLKPEQITSGTLAYAIGTGKAIISTPYWYAEELLADGRGILVPFRDPDAIAREVTELLTNSDKCDEVRLRAKALGKQMSWSKVAQAYLKVFKEAATEQEEWNLPYVPPSTMMASLPGQVPTINLTHLRRMTDGTGLLQHATYSVPNYAEGYCLDDNARALLLVAHLHQSHLVEGPQLIDLATRYLAYVNYAFDRKSKKFRNFMSFQRGWLEDEGSEDSHGRALWGLGTAASRFEEPGLRTLSIDLFMQGLTPCLEHVSIRAWAYTLLGLDEFLTAEKDNALALKYVEDIGEKLLNEFRHYASTSWPWFEDVLSYANARLPQALLLAGNRLGRRDMTTAALEALSWLVKIQKAKAGHFEPVGSDHPYRKGEAKPRFDQQPLEACGTASACLSAFRLTGEVSWKEEAQLAFDWFGGRNHLGIAMYDPTTGGCFDGLHADRPNENQGAESTLSFLVALAELREAEFSSTGTGTKLAYVK